MKQQEKEQRGEEAFQLYQEIKDNELQRRKLFISNMLDLVKMYDKKLYKEVLGEGTEPKWSGFLADVAIYYSRAKIERWQRIIEKLVKEFNIEVDSFIDIPETRIDEVIDIVKRIERKEKRKIKKEEVEKLLNTAREIIPLDWKNIIRKSKGEETTEECKHEFQIYQICKKCGFRAKLDIDNKQFEKEKNS